VDSSGLIDWTGLHWTPLDSSPQNLSAVHLLCSVPRVHWSPLDLGGGERRTPVFHISMLEPSIPNTIPDRVQTPLPPVMVDGEPEYKISEILDSKLDNRQRLCKLLYLVKWSGYEGTDDETSWLLATELGNAPKLINHLHHQYAHKPCTLSIP